MTWIRAGRTAPEQTRRDHRHGRRRLRYGSFLIAATLLASWGASATGGAAMASATRAAAPVSSHPATAHPVIHPAAAPAPGQPNLGPNVYIFTPSMPQSQIQDTVDAIAKQQVSNQFGTQRYALLFEPGTYGTAANPLIFQVGYYTEVAGLGSSPGDVTINGSIDVYNQCFAPDNCIALDNFWRSMSNLTINVAGGTGCQAATEFWAVSQAAPMRRVHVDGLFSLMDYCSAGPQFASGGFIADSSFTGKSMTNGSQQQFLVRNTNIDGWSNGVWNQVFAGDPGAPAQSFSSGDPGSTNPYTTLASVPETQEEPFLQTSPSGSFSVFVPALRHNSRGPSWTGGAEAGRSVPLSKFFIAGPTTSAITIDSALSQGKDLLLLPGVYHLSIPILVTSPDTVVLGLGFPTLVPTGGTAAMVVSNVPGVKLSGMIFDAGPKNSPVLLQVGVPQAGQGLGNPADPTLVQDVFFRIGGATAGKATDSLVVDSSNVILDDIWAWRADHGAGVGWTDNTANNGLTVNGDNVMAYGLFVEHYQKAQVIWNGQHGEDIFFQSEMPYDPPDQKSWMQNAATDGYPAVQVSAGVKTFQGYGMGTYCFFDLGVPIEASNAYTVPSTPGVQMHDLLTRFLNASGGIEHVINGTGDPVTADSPGPSDLVSFP
jgi:hypothetical protein